MTVTDCNYMIVIFTITNIFILFVIKPDFGACKLIETGDLALRKFILNNIFLYCKITIFGLKFLPIQIFHTACKTITRRRNINKIVFIFFQIIQCFALADSGTLVWTCWVA